MMYRIQRFIPDGQFIAVLPVNIKRPCNVEFIAYEVFSMDNNKDWLTEIYLDCVIMTREEYFDLPLYV